MAEMLEFSCLEVVDGISSEVHHLGVNLSLIDIGEARKSLLNMD